MTAMRAPIPMPVRQGTPEWLAARQHGIGSSDAPVIAGERGSVVELWAQKAGLVEPEPPDEQTAGLFEWGHRLEPVVAEWYAEHTGRQVRRANRLLRHPDVAYAFASLDRVVVGERRIVEIKTTRFGWTGEEAVPGAVQAQVQHQLWVTGYDVADVAVLTGGSLPRIVTIERDPAFIDDLAFLEAEFWGWVTTQTRPPIDGSDETRRALARMHPVDDGRYLAPTPDLVTLAAQLAEARAAKKAADAAESTVANAIRAIVADASGVEGLLSLKKNADSTRTNWPAVAKAYRELLSDRPAEELDAIESIHSETVQGARVLRLL